jgi:cytoskeleton-associated protein 5
MILFQNLSRDFGLFQHWVRTAATASITTWGECCGFKEFFAGEMIGNALKSGSPALRTELWAWLTEKLPTCKCKEHTVT